MSDYITLQQEGNLPLTVGDALDVDGDLDIAVGEENTYLTLAQVKKLHSHLGRVLADNSPARDVDALAKLVLNA